MRINHTFECELGGDIIEMEIESSGPSKDDIDDIRYYLTTDADSRIEIISEFLRHAISKYVDRYDLIDEAFRIYLEDQAISKYEDKIENGYRNGI